MPYGRQTAILATCTIMPTEELGHQPPNHIQVHRHPATLSQYHRLNPLVQDIHSQDGLLPHLLLHRVISPVTPLVLTITVLAIYMQSGQLMNILATCTIMPTEELGHQPPNLIRGLRLQATHS